jgi:hypothetical protein
LEQGNPFLLTVYSIQHRPGELIGTDEDIFTEIYQVLQEYVKIVEKWK